MVPLRPSFIGEHGREARTRRTLLELIDDIPDGIFLLRRFQARPSLDAGRGSLIGITDDLSKPIKTCLP